MKAMVLCAGHGTRLGDLTREVPKPMLPLGDRPLLAYLLAHLRCQGWSDIAINLHFHGEQIVRAFGNGASWGLRLVYAHEPRLLGTSGAVRGLRDFFSGTDVFLVQYGDVLTDQDFRPLLARHRSHNALVTFLVHPRPRSNSVVIMDEATGRVIGFLERPTETERRGIASTWVNSGVCVCSPEILDLIPADRPSDFPRDVFVPLVATGRLFAVPLDGYRCAIDSPERLQEARSAIADGRCRIQPLPAAAVPPP